MSSGKTSWETPRCLAAKLVSLCLSTAVCGNVLEPACCINMGFSGTNFLRRQNYFKHQNVRGLKMHALKRITKALVLPSRNAVGTFRISLRNFALGKLICEIVRLSDFTKNSW